MTRDSACRKQPSRHDETPHPDTKPPHASTESDKGGKGEGEDDLTASLIKALQPSNELVGHTRQPQGKDCRRHYPAPPGQSSLRSSYVRQEFFGYRPLHFLLGLMRDRSYIMFVLGARRSAAMPDKPFQEQLLDRLGELSRIVTAHQVFLLALVASRFWALYEQHRKQLKEQRS